MKTLIRITLLLSALIILGNIDYSVKTRATVPTVPTLDLGPNASLINQYPFYKNYQQSYDGLTLFGTGPLSGASIHVFSDPAIGVNYYLKVLRNDNIITNNANVEVGDNIEYILKEFEDTDIAWNVTGYFVDTPYGRWVNNINDTPTNFCDDNDYGFGKDYKNNTGVDSTYKAYYPFLVKKPAYSITHSGTATLNCTNNGFDCTVLSSGTIDSEINIDQTEGKFFFQYYVENEAFSRSEECLYNQIPLKTYAQLFSAPNWFFFSCSESIEVQICGEGSSNEYCPIPQGSDNCSSVGLPPDEGTASYFAHIIPAQKIEVSLNAINGTSDIDPPVVICPIGTTVSVGEEVEYVIEAKFAEVSSSTPPTPPTPPAGCSNGIQDQDETSPDCGGVCGACKIYTNTITKKKGDHYVSTYDDFRAYRNGGTLYGAISKMCKLAGKSAAYSDNPVQGIDSKCTSNLRCQYRHNGDWRDGCRSEGWCSQTKDTDTPPSIGEGIEWVLCK